jgi:DoxX-like protein
MSLDIANMIAELRVLCGLAFIPHILAKIFKREMTLGFFQAAGFRPAAAFMYFSLLVEVLASVSLCAGLLVPYAAAIAAIFMFGSRRRCVQGFPKTMVLEPGRLRISRLLGLRLCDRGSA